jgi:hypothetical protein
VACRWKTLPAYVAQQGAGKTAGSSLASLLILLQALLPLFIFSDISPRCGGTAIIPGSHLDIGYRLSIASEQNHSLSADDLKILSAEVAATRADEDIMEANGEAGTLYVLHPFIVHAGSRNVCGKVRVIANPAVPFVQSPVLLQQPLHEACACMPVIAAAVMSHAPSSQADCALSRDEDNSNDAPLDDCSLDSEVIRVHSSAIVLAVLMGACVHSTA